MWSADLSLPPLYDLLPYFFILGEEVQSTVQIIKPDPEWTNAFLSFLYCFCTRSILVIRYQNKIPLMERSLSQDPFSRPWESKRRDSRRNFVHSCMRRHVASDPREGCVTHNNLPLNRSVLVQTTRVWTFDPHRGLNVSKASMYIAVCRNLDAFVNNF